MTVPPLPHGLELRCSFCGSYDQGQLVSGRPLAVREKRPTTFICFNCAHRVETAMAGSETYQELFRLDSSVHAGCCAWCGSTELPLAVGDNVAICRKCVVQALAVSGGAPDCQ